MRRALLKLIIIIFQDGSFLTFYDFFSKFPIKMNFLRYHGLCHAISKWIKKLKAHNVHAPVGLQANDHSGMSIDKISCKSASQIYVKVEFETLTAEKRMKNAGLSEETIHYIHSIPFKVTKDTRLAIFQFKIIHHILPTNVTLFRV